MTNNEELQATEELHKALIHRWFVEGVSSNDEEKALRIADEVFAEDYVDGDSPGAPQNREEFKRMIAERVLPTFADIEITIEHILAEGDMAAAYVRFEGTHVGPFRGVPATGKRIVFHEATISFIEDGRLKAVRGKADWLAVMHQLGAAG